MGSLARALSRKLLLIAKAHDIAPRGPQFVPTDASRAAQRMHLERLRAVERYPGCTFTSPENLAKQILSSAILDLLAAAHPRIPSVRISPDNRKVLQDLGLLAELEGNWHG
jgi:hypothetical protein